MITKPREFGAFFVLHAIDFSITLATALRDLKLRRFIFDATRTLR